jgi:hypothetical protein
MSLFKEGCGRYSRAGIYLSSLVSILGTITALLDLPFRCDLNRWDFAGTHGDMRVTCVCRVDNPEFRNRPVTDLLVRRRYLLYIEHLLVAE